MDNHIELQQTFTHIDTRYRFTYHEFANLLEIEVLIAMLCASGLTELSLKYSKT